ncbi:MAG: phosphatase PAP2 family protein [Actinobacteria bacterium]|nr:phosphatase PAP2 family protein [Actinomycetota bacterium]
MTDRHARSDRPDGCVRPGWLLAPAAAVALILLYVVAVWTVPGQVLDTQVMLAAGSVLASATWPAQLLNAVSPATVLAVLCLLVALALGLRGTVTAVTAAATVIGTVLASEVLKHVLVRPQWVDDAGNSLPSGHVSAMAALAVAAFLAVPRAARVTTAVLGALGVIATAAATMSLGWHRPSDVVASVLLAVGIGSAVAATAAAVPKDRSGGGSRYLPAGFS